MTGQKALGVGMFIGGVRGGGRGATDAGAGFGAFEEVVKGEARVRGRGREQEG
jgi:hypothetical protein